VVTFVFEVCADVTPTEDNPLVGVFTCPFTLRVPPLNTILPSECSPLLNRSDMNAFALSIAPC
jgi:hypothetical protein